MSGRVLYQFARADFLDRVRRYSFLLILAFAVGLAYLTYTGGITLQLGNYRGVYNSAWVGSMLTLITTTFISLAGFYMVKNTVQRDRQTRVGLVLATTPMSKSLYTIGKALSNFAVLSAMVAVLALAAVILQLIRGEGGALELPTLLAPFVWVALPAMAMTAAIAVLFEALPGLGGGVGNVIYFFAWTGYVGASGVAGIHEYLGFGLFMHSMGDTLKRIDPNYGGFSLQVGPTAHAMKTFLWPGINWTAPVILERLLWFAVAVGVAWFAALFFHRFDPAHEGRHSRRRAASGPVEEPAAVGFSAPAQPAFRLTPLTPIARAGRFPALVLSELRLMLKGHGWWWYAVAFGLFLGGIAIPDAQARGAFAAFAWIWPVLVWAQMGAREVRYDTGKLIFSCAHSLGLQLPAVSIAGFLVAICTGGGTAIRFLMTGDGASLAAWLAGALFVPSLALALGVWSGSSRLFEAIYTLWWYIGAMNHVPGLDFTGFTHTPFSTPFYVAAAAALFVAAHFGRRAKLAYA